MFDCIKKLIAHSTALIISICSSRLFFYHTVYKQTPVATKCTVAVEVNTYVNIFINYAEHLLVLLYFVLRSEKCSLNAS